MLDNILLPYRINRSLALDRGGTVAGPTSWRERVGIGDKLDRPPGRALPGRAAARGGLPRAAVPSPTLLLADEPTGNLDPVEQGPGARHPLRLRPTSAGATLVTVTHDHDLLPRFRRVIDFKEFYVPGGAAARCVTCSTSPGATWPTTGSRRPILVASITLIVYPAGRAQRPRRTERRAADRPRRGDAAAGRRQGQPARAGPELALLRDRARRRRTTYAEAQRVADSGLAQPIPLYVRFRSREHPIVGTTPRLLRLPRAAQSPAAADGGARRVRARVARRRRARRRARRHASSRRPRASSTSPASIR